MIYTIFRHSVIILCCFTVIKNFQTFLTSEEKRTVIQVTGEGNSLAEQTGYSNLAVDVISKLVEQYQMQNSSVGVWCEKESNPYGTQFMFQIALDYFRVCTPQEDVEKWEQTKMITKESELHGLEYVVSNQSLDRLKDLGYKSIHDGGWIHLYHNKTHTKKEECP